MQKYFSAAWVSISIPTWQNFYVCFLINLEIEPKTACYLAFMKEKENLLFSKLKWLPLHMFYNELITRLKVLLYFCISQGSCGVWKSLKVLKFFESNIFILKNIIFYGKFVKKSWILLAYYFLIWDSILLNFSEFLIKKK